jgi:hypothetical protein
MSNLDRMRVDLDRLIHEGDLLYASMTFALRPDEVVKAYGLRSSAFNDHGRLRGFECLND